MSWLLKLGYITNVAALYVNAGGGGGPTGDGLLLETGDFLLAENGDFIILE